MKIRETRKKSVVVRQGTMALPPPGIHGFPKDWRDRIRADLSAQLEAGGTLYGVRSDGAYIWVPLETLTGSDPVSLPPFEAISFSLGDLWPDTEPEADRFSS